MIDYKATGEKIFVASVSHFGTVKAVAEFFDINIMCIYKWGRGVCLPRIEKIVALADEIGCTVDSLIIRENADV